MVSLADACVLVGFMLDNPLLTTVGSLIGVSGSILSYIMCVAMNRSLTNVLFGGIAALPQSDYKIEGTITKTSVDETVEALTNAESVILVCPHLTSRPKGEVADVVDRSWAMVWLLRRLNMPFRILRGCCARRVLTCASQSILLQAACLDNVTSYWPKLLFLTTVCDLIFLSFTFL